MAIPLNLENAKQMASLLTKYYEEEFPRIVTSFCLLYIRYLLSSCLFPPP